jgi:hypothetical protein
MKCTMILEYYVKLTIEKFEVSICTGIHNTRNYIDKTYLFLEKRIIFAS